MGSDKTLTNTTLDCGDNTCTVRLGLDVTGTLQATNFPALTGDVTTTAGSLATTLATVNSNVGSFGSATAIPTFTVNAKGLLTAAGSVSPQLASNSALGVAQCDGTTITCSSGVMTSVGSAATSVAVDTTTVASGTSGYLLNNNGGTLGNVPFPKINSQTFTSSGTFTTPANSMTATVYHYRMVGGGGGGGYGSTATSSPGGGGGGAYAEGAFTGVAPSTGITITVGAFGAAGTSGSAAQQGAAPRLALLFQSQQVAAVGRLMSPQQQRVQAELPGL